MAFIQNIRPENPYNFNERHTLTHYVKKGRRYFDSVVNYSKGSSKFISPFAKVLSAAGVINNPSSILPRVQRGITLTCTVIEMPEILAKGVNGSGIAEKMLEIASSAASISIGVMTCFKLGDFIVETLSIISCSFGNVFRVAEGISAAVPFMGVFSGIQIVKSMIDVGIEGVKLYKTAKKIVEVKKKINLWKGLTWNDTAFISKKLEHLKSKQIRSEKGLEKIEGGLKTSHLAYQSSILHVEKRWKKLTDRKAELSKRNPVVRLFGQIAPQIKLTIALLKKEEAEKTHLTKMTAINKISDRHNLRSLKIRNFKIIESKIKNNKLTPMDRTALKHFQTRQLEKLKIKKSNLKLESLKTGLKIGLKILVVISLVATMALTFSGVGSAPGIITNATMVLFIMAAEYGLSKFNQYNKPKTWLPVHAPRLWVKKLE